MKITKEFLIDAIIGGVPIPMGGITETLTPFCGNQHNEDWCWNREELEKMDLDSLIDFYKTRRHP
jgi:hypothetical protein